jgi:rhodanese-related sulfurtransferase
MLAEANQQVKALTVSKVRELVDNPDYIIIDVRNENEVETEGKIPNSINFSRGMLEFYIDPESPYHNPIFQTGKSIIFYCKSGGRSVLAAQQAMKMGVPNTCHMAGGFAEWKNSGM